ncbi:MAG TPA: M64 family metallopeptidase [Pyrinomonadaceae bacterium]|nr:M64 family metallopeptidase [Pyrinomonadaceae bacterium]
MTTHPRISSALFALLLFAGVSSLAHAETFETIVNNGPSSNRVDIAIMGDGYTASQMGKYQADVQQFVQAMFAQDPYREYQSYFNVHRIDVVSNQSGADHPERNSFVDTALDAAYNCNGTQRLICVNVSKALAVVGRSVSPAQSDIKLVIVNDPEYGGSGGAVAVASVHASAVEIILHELGHSFGLLGDEYGGSTCGGPDSAPNITLQTDRASIKWNYWIDSNTAIPTLTTTPGVPGLYDGAQYCDHGYYRPTYDSKMRTLDRPFEQINMEQLIKRIYNLVSPLESTSPTSSALTITRGQTQSFSVNKLVPFTHQLSVTWSLDGQAQNIADSFLLDTTSLTTGSHSIDVLLKDNTTSVRRDPDLLLEETHHWDVTIVAPSSTPPMLLTEVGSSRAIALDSVTLMRDPFSLLAAHNFSLDQRTRLALFATNADLLGDTLTAQVENGAQTIPLPVEYADKVPGYEITMIVVRLPDGLPSSGDVNVSITLRGLTSNKVLVGIKP